MFIFFSSDWLKGLINKPIDFDLFQEKLGMLAKSKYFEAVSQQLLSEKASDMILYNEFSILYTYFCGWIQRVF